MTNEGAALQITENAKNREYLDSRYHDLVEDISYSAAMTMAEWKDTQFEKFLLKKLKVAEIDYDENSKIGSDSDKMICRVRKATISGLLNEFLVKNTDV